MLPKYWGTQDFCYSPGVTKKKKKQPLGHVTLEAALIRALSGASEILEIFLCKCRRKAGGWINKHGLAPGLLAGLPELGLRMSSSDLSLL